MWNGPEWEHLNGKGCWYCAWEKPVVKLGSIAVCFSCLTRVFPGWGDGRISGWLIRQTEQHLVWVSNQTKKAKKAQMKRDMAKVMEWLG